MSFYGTLNKMSFYGPLGKMSFYGTLSKIRFYDILVQRGINSKRKNVFYGP